MLQIFKKVKKILLNYNELKGMAIGLRLPEYREIKAQGDGYEDRERMRDSSSWGVQEGTEFTGTETTKSETGKLDLFSAIPIYD